MSASMALPRHEMSQCYRCGFEAVQPKLLPCLHTFCLQCLEPGELQRPGRSQEGRRMACPKCSVEFAVPHEGLHGDIFVERLMKTQKGLCDVCLDNENCVDARRVVPSASKYCSLCCQGLCECCSVEHSRQKLLKGHTLVDFSIETAFEEARLHPSNMCTKHLTVLSTQFFCLTCQRFICSMCLVEDHMEHKWSKWEEVVDQFRGNLRNSVEQVSGLLGYVGRMKEEVMGEEIRRFSSKTAEIEFQIRERCRELRESIDRHEKALLGELKSLEEARLEKINLEINTKFGRYLVQLESYKKYCTAVTDDGSPNEIDWALNDLKLRERCEELKDQYEVFAASNPQISSFAEVSFELPDIDDILHNRDLVGKLTSRTDLLEEPFTGVQPVDFEAVNAHARSNTGRPMSFFQNNYLHALLDLKICSNVD